MQILNGTVKEGDVWYYPQLELRANVAGVSAFQAAETWCGIVRGEYKRRDEEREWKSVESAKEGKQEDASRGAPVREDGASELDRGGTRPTEKVVQASQGTLEEILTAKLESLKSDLVESRRAYHDAKQLKTEAGKRTVLIVNEIKAVEAAMEVACGTREDADPMGSDIHRQVSDSGQEGGREVGHEDDTEDPPQSVSSEGEGAG
jgi:hypothetical protein